MLYAIKKQSSGNLTVERSFGITYPAVKLKDFFFCLYDSVENQHVLIYSS